MVIGVTGGVGSGKSAIMNILKEEYGAHIIIADDVARELQQPGNICYNLIVDEFGEGILGGSSDDMGRHFIDRGRLSEIVFADENKLNTLNLLVHPQVKEDIKRQIELIYADDDHALIAIEAALFIGAGYEDIIDEMWAVIAEHEVRIERLMRTRGYSLEKAESIMRSQPSDSEFRLFADYVIDNSTTLDSARSQIINRLMEI